MGQSRSVSGVAHERIGDEDAHVEPFDLGALLGVGPVYHKAVEEIGIVTRHGERGRRLSQLAEHFGSGAFDRLPPDDGRYGEGALLSQLLAHAGKRNDRVNADERIGWAQHHQVGGVERGSNFDG